MNPFKSDPIKVEIQGRELKCLICGHDTFFKQEVQLNGTASFFKNTRSLPPGTCHICAKRGYIHWFLPQ